MNISTKLWTFLLMLYSLYASIFEQAVAEEGLGGRGGSTWFGWFRIIVLLAIALILLSRILMNANISDNLQKPNKFGHR